MKNYNEIFSENSMMESERLILRGFNLDDDKDVYLYASDDEVTKYLTWPPHKTLEQTQSVIKEFYTGRPGIFAIELKSEKKCIGCIDLRLINEHNKASFGYVINKEYWNRGYTSEALILILDLAFNKLELNRVESTHYVGNEGSGKVMQKCGMSYEGTGLQEVVIRKISYDVVHYAILKDEYNISSDILGTKEGELNEK